MSAAQASTQLQIEDAVVTQDEFNIVPQDGPQFQFLASPADILVGGGSAGGGKTWSLLAEPLRYLQLEKTDAGVVIFRRTYPQITQEGGLWDESKDLYQACGGHANQQDLTWKFPNGLRIKFAHLQHDKDRFTWKGAQIPIIGFDQLEDFTEDQFWYLISRNRRAPKSKNTIRPYIRATCNPVPADDAIGGWLNRLIAWWVDQETGFAIPERSGVIRFFVRDGDTLDWGDSKEELVDRHSHVFNNIPEDMEPADLIKSFTFIPSKLEDNKILDQGDPQYRANLMSLASFERDRLLGGNWNARPTAGEVLDRAWFSIVRAVPVDISVWIRYWDKAGTEVAPGMKSTAKWSAGALVGIQSTGRIIIANIVRGRWSAGNRERVIRQTAEADAKRPGVSTGTVRLITWIEQEPGSGGKESAESTIVNTLAGFEVHKDKVTGDKLTRAMPFVSQAEVGNVSLVEGDWNEDFLKEAHAYDGRKGTMDQIDAVGGGYNKANLEKPNMMGATW